MNKRTSEAKRRLELFETRSRPQPVSDWAILEANGEGMDAFDAGLQVGDNPNKHPSLRRAWHEGWESAQHHRANLDAEIGKETL